MPSSKKVITILGNRPQFIKAAAVSKHLLQHGIEEVIINTGQHFDYLMSDVFIDELDLKKPSYNLGINRCSEIELIAKVMIKLEEIFLTEKPNMVLVYGDTNSTLAAALVASKLHIPLAHVEAGPRLGDKSIPEEYNRILVDHSANILFAPDRTSVNNLKKEGITEQSVIFSGDVMCDVFLNNQETLNASNTQPSPNDYVLLTLHRQHNVDEEQSLQNIINLLETVKEDIYFPIHPRTLKNFEKFGFLSKINKEKIKISDPLPYKELMHLLLNAKGVITDSGGFQKEAFFAKKPCYVLLDVTPWPEIEETGWQKVIGSGHTLTIKNIDFDHDFKNVPEIDLGIFGNGQAGSIVAQTISKFIG